MCFAFLIIYLFVRPRAEEGEQSIRLAGAEISAGGADSLFGAPLRPIAKCDAPLLRMARLPVIKIFLRLPSDGV